MLERCLLFHILCFAPEHVKMKYQETHLDGFPHPLEELCANKSWVRS